MLLCFQLGKFFGEISGASFILKELVDNLGTDQPQMFASSKFVFKRFVYCVVICENYYILFCQKKAKDCYSENFSE